jgi:hypothetical protein
MCKAMAAVGRNDVVLFLDSVFNANSDSLLASRQMTETADLLLLVQSICSHLHPTAEPTIVSINPLKPVMDIVPYHNHIVVQLLQFLLGHIDGVWGRI